MSFSIKQLSLVFVYVAVALISLLNAGHPFAIGIVQLVNFVLLVGLAYGIWLTTGERRAFRIGFLGWVAGAVLFNMVASPYSLTNTLLERAAPTFQPKSASGAYPVSGYVPSVSDSTASSPVIISYPAIPADPTSDSSYGIPVVTQPTNDDVSTPVTAADPTYVPLPSTAAPQAPPVLPPPVARYTTQSTPVDIVWQNGFTTIGNSLFTMLLGVIGGWVTVFVYRKRQRMIAESDLQSAT